MPCTLCGLPLPKPPVSDAGHDFCCIGCREVYRAFGEDALAQAKVSPRDTAPPPGSRESFLWIDGMHCASCEFLIGKLALKHPGVLDVASSYATATARIVYDPAQVQEAELPALLSRHGYRARLRGEPAPEHEEGLDLLRLVSGVTAASLVMMLTFIFIYPIHGGWLTVEDYGAMRRLAFEAVPIFLFFLTTILVFFVGWPILRGAWIGMRARLPNMDLLLALAILAAYGYSIIQFFNRSIDLYFEVAGTLVMIITIGRYLEHGARARATESLKSILQAWAPQACVLRGGQYLDCPLDEVRPHDRVFVRQGEAIPVDGSIVAGRGAVDESLMTGEPFPVSRGEGEKVLGGSRLLEGNLEIDTGPQVESRMANLARILWNTQSASTGLQARVDRLSRRFVPGVLALAALVGIGFLAAGAGAEKALLAALATLIVSCPCTFGLAIPLTTAAAIGAALRRGIVVTGPDLFEKSPRVDVVALDKTGTLSSGEMAVVEVIGSAEVAARAAAVERHSPHPVARAIAQLDAGRSASEVELHPGRGAVATVGGKRIAVGSRALFATLGWTVPAPLAARAEQSRHGEAVVSYVGWDGVAEGVILTRDRSRPAWDRVVESLRRHCRVVLLTGAEHPNGYRQHVDEVHAGVPPEAKAAVIRRLKAQGRVAMIGDGSNDAPALAEADLGIAFGAPTALAAEAADIVIPGKRLERVLEAFLLIGVTRRRIRQNLGWALAYNAIAIPLAATGMLSPLVAAAAMSASSILVVANAARPILGKDPFEGEGDERPAPVPGAHSSAR
ncbi:MAG: heavy metal translocating P-type ATPase [Betaproteobacteria bacterium HGW-Betaproteobacteria-14]|nr:MAG: heavy metal translocating P-type ATPase [Betaproteobacteria bacterium HGW-Betaproteobacteria-14]